MTFLPRTRLMRCRRSLARWHASLDCPKGTSSAGAPSIFSSADATCSKSISGCHLHRSSRIGLLKCLATHAQQAAFRSLTAQDEEGCYETATLSLLQDRTMHDLYQLCFPISQGDRYRMLGGGQRVHRHGTALAHEERLAAPLARESALGHLEQLALRVGLPPVPHALHTHAHRVAAAQHSKCSLHVRPQRRYQLPRVLQMQAHHISTCTFWSIRACHINSTGHRLCPVTYKEACICCCTPPL